MKLRRQTQVRGAVLSSINALDGGVALWYTHGMIANAAIYLALMATMSLAWAAPGWWR